MLSYTFCPVATGERKSKRRWWPTPNRPLPPHRRPAPGTTVGVPNTAAAGGTVFGEWIDSVAADGTMVFMADASNASQSGVYGADVSGDVWPVVAIGDASLCYYSESD